MLNVGENFDDSCRGKLIYNLAVMAGALMLVTKRSLMSITSDKPMHLFGEADVNS